MTKRKKKLCEVKAHESEKNPWMMMIPVFTYFIITTTVTVNIIMFIDVTVVIASFITVIFIFKILILPNIKPLTSLHVAENRNLKYFRYLIIEHILIALCFKLSQSTSSSPSALPF
jgi:hypothetical protein